MSQAKFFFFFSFFFFFPATHWSHPVCVCVCGWVGVCGGQIVYLATCVVLGTCILRPLTATVHSTVWVEGVGGGGTYTTLVSGLYCSNPRVQVVGYLQLWATLLTMLLTWDLPEQIPSVLWKTLPKKKKQQQQQHSGRVGQELLKLLDPGTLREAKESQDWLVKN